MRRRRKNNNSNVVIILVVLLVTVSLGYAFLTQDLTINGTGKIASASWDIHFEDLVPNPNNIDLSNDDVAAAINPSTLTDITYTITFQQPGDFYEFTVAAVNGGSMDAMIGSIINNLNGNPIGTGNQVPNYVRYSVTYNDGVAIATNHILEAGESETYKVRLEYRTDINPSDLPGELQTLTFTFGVNYVQADDNVIPVPHPITVYTANILDYERQMVVHVGSPINSSITQYSTAAEARAALSLEAGADVPFCLKHTVVNGIVTESYLEFIITEAMVHDNPGMTAGIYTLKGDANAFSTNVSTLQTAFGSSQCHENSFGRYICSPLDFSFDISVGSSGDDYFFAIRRYFGCTYDSFSDDTYCSDGYD